MGTGYNAQEAVRQDKVVYQVKSAFSPIPLGTEGENCARVIVWDISDWIKTYGAGQVLLMAQRPEESESYPAPVSTRGHLVMWEVRSVDIKAGKFGQAQLSYSVGDKVLARSPVYRTFAVAAVGEDPGEDQSWVTALIEELAPAVNAAAEAAESADQAAESAGTAKESETAAAESAETSSQAASSAAGSASAAKGYAEAAEKSAGSITGDAEAAKSSADKAAASAAAAKGSETAAAESAGKAADSAKSAAEASAQAAEAPNPPPKRCKAAESRKRVSRPRGPPRTVRAEEGAGRPQAAQSAGSAAESKAAEGYAEHRSGRKHHRGRRSGKVVSGCGGGIRVRGQRVGDGGGRKRRTGCRQRQIRRRSVCTGRRKPGKE